MDVSGRDGDGGVIDGVEDLRRGGLAGDDILVVASGHACDSGRDGGGIKIDVLDIGVVYSQDSSAIGANGYIVGRSANLDLDGGFTIKVGIRRVGKSDGEGDLTVIAFCGVRCRDEDGGCIDGVGDVDGCRGVRVIHGFIVAASHTGNGGRNFGGVLVGVFLVGIGDGQSSSAIGANGYIVGRSANLDLDGGFTIKVGIRRVGKSDGEGDLTVIAFCGVCSHNSDRSYFNVIIRI